MYDLLNANSFSRSPFQFARMEYLKGRVDENYRKYVEARQQSQGRLDSAHLLMKVLSSLTVPFSGDLFAYMRGVHSQAKMLCSSLDITTSWNAGGIFKEGLFYSKCPEIVVYSRNPKYSPIDLWKGWRTIPAVEVLTHPVTDMNVFELGVKNEASLGGSDLVVVSIDIPLLAGQWKMWQAANPGLMMENFLTTVVIPNMMRSHLNLVIFNKLMVKLGLRKPVSVRTNLPFAQTPVDKHADDVVNEVYDKLSVPKLSATKILDTIPVIYGHSYLTEVSLSSMAPTSQVIWALISQKVDPMAVVLKFGAITGYDKLVDEIIHIRRTVIEINESKLLSSGLTSGDGSYLSQRFIDLIINNLPKT